MSSLVSGGIPDNFDQIQNEYTHDRIWFDNNIRTFRSRYPNKYVAVRKEEIIAADTDIRKLVQTLRKRGIKTNNLVIEFVPEVDCIWVL